MPAFVRSFGGSVVAYRLLQHEPMPGALRRLARELAERALAELESLSDDPSAAAFAVRRRIKKLRSVMRLFRGSFAAFELENEGLRDVARSLGPLREARALAQTFDALVRELPDSPEIVALRACVSARAALDPALSRGALAGARWAMIELRDRSESWRVEGEGFGAIEEGLRRSYARSRRRLREAVHEATHEGWHRWRIALKHDRLQTRLLADALAAEKNDRYELLVRLSDVLGRLHDMGELRAAIEASGLAVPPAVAHELADRPARLAGSARLIGGAAYEEHPREHLERVQGAWEAWRGAE